MLAAPTSATVEFAAVGEGIELLWYDEMVSVQALLTLLDRAYNDFAERLAALDVPRVSAEVLARGRIPPIEAQELLRCYTRAELGAAVRSLGQGVDVAAPVWVEGVGLCSVTWLDAVQARAHVEVALSVAGRMPLDSLRARLVAAQPELAELSEPAVEMLALRAGLHVLRSSIFEAEVAVAEDPAPSSPSFPAPPARRAQPRPRPRRTPSRAEQYATPPLFAPEGASD